MDGLSMNDLSFEDIDALANSLIMSSGLVDVVDTTLEDEVAAAAIAEALAEVLCLHCALMCAYCMLQHRGLVSLLSRRCIA